MTTPNDPPASWPEHGKIEFKDVSLAYREGLPLVLKGVTFEVKAGEKVSLASFQACRKATSLITRRLVSWDAQVPARVLFCKPCSGA